LAVTSSSAINADASAFPSISCLDRHCPKCQSLARAQWLDDRRAELLDTQYFHVVLTLPKEIAGIACQNKARVYGILFRAAADTLSTIAADPKHLGAEIGFFAALHTWSQNLLHHPHLHCVVAGGGLSIDGTRWISCRPRYFLPVPVLSCLFRRLFLGYLQKAFDAGHLEFFSSLEPLRERRAFSRYLAPLRRAKWVVYAKPPFAGPEQVWSTSDAMRTWSPSPTIACSTSTTVRFASAGRTIGTATGRSHDRLGA
jgi:Putative transposase/Transposase zinc-binding domain